MPKEIKEKKDNWVDEFVSWYKSYSVFPPWSSIIGWIVRHKKKWEKEEYKKGYNDCLKDQKLTGEKYQHLYL